MNDKREIVWESSPQLKRSNRATHVILVVVWIALIAIAAWAMRSIVGA